MPVNEQAYRDLKATLDSRNVTLVAVSKTQSAADILQLYGLGQRDFGENYVQELIDKQRQLPPDIRWHFIGHLQTNKVRQILPIVHLIQSVDSLRLLEEINKQGSKLQLVSRCLLQVHIAREETKFGLDDSELQAILPKQDQWLAVRIAGLMGMASFTEEVDRVRAEFRQLKKWFDDYRAAASLDFSILSMGMSQDYSVAVAEGSTLVRIGSLLFGERQPKS